MTKDTIASKVGRPPKFKTPLELAEIADKYFAWCEANPIETSKRKLVGAKQTGKGYLISEKAAAEKAAATRWTLSDRERAIIAQLSKNDSNGN